MLTEPAVLAFGFVCFIAGGGFAIGVSILKFYIKRELQMRAMEVVMSGAPAWSIDSTGRVRIDLTQADKPAVDARRMDLRLVKR
jgi:hypothetical protein